MFKTHATGGQGYAWGGKNHWWFEIRPDSHWQTHWRGDTTERSRLLLQTLHKEEPSEIEPDEEEDEAEKEVQNPSVEKSCKQNKHRVSRVDGDTSGPRIVAGAALPPPRHFLVVLLGLVY